LSRLAELVAADGDGAQATAILKSIDDLKRLKTLRERFQLLSLLAEQDQPREAERRAMRWVRSAHDDTTAVSLIDHLARSKYPDSAYEVAKDAGVPGDGISLTVAERLIEKDQNGAALLYLRGWLERAKTADTDTAIRFVDSAIAVGAPELAIQGARQFGYVLLPQQSLLKLAAALEQSGATIEAGEVRRAVAGGAPVLPVAAAIDSAESGAQPVTGRSTARGAPVIESGSRQRSVVLVDPLDGWRRSLFTSMSSDAQRRMQALFVGPKRPSLHAGRHFGGHAHFRDLRAERHSGAKFLKKTSRVLLRTKKLKALRAKRLPNGEAKTKEQAVSPLDLLTPQPKTKPNGTQKP
jgi:hypothetical protein